MAISFAVLIYMSMGLVEFGQYFYIKHCFESAIRDAARYGILSTATQSQFVTTLTSGLQQANVTYNSSWLTITDQTAGGTVSDISAVPAGDQLQFQLSTTYGNIPNAVRPLYSMTGQGIGSGKTVVAVCIMMKE